MWPTFYIPSTLRSGLRNCWDYLIPSGNEVRYYADGISADPDIVFSIKPYHTYRAIGRLTWKLTETAAKGGQVAAHWAPSVSVAAIMCRSGCAAALTQTESPTSVIEVGGWDRTADTIEDDQIMVDYPFGSTGTEHQHVIVDLFVAAGASAGTVALHWGNVDAGSSTMRLMNLSIITVKEYAPL